MEGKAQIPQSRPVDAEAPVPEEKKQKTEDATKNPTMISIQGSGYFKIQNHFITATKPFSVQEKDMILTIRTDEPAKPMSSSLTTWQDADTIPPSPFGFGYTLIPSFSFGPRPNPAFAWGNSQPELGRPSYNGEGPIPGFGPAPNSNFGFGGIMPSVGFGNRIPSDTFGPSSFGFAVEEVKKKKELKTDRWEITEPCGPSKDMTWTPKDSDYGPYICEFKFRLGDIGTITVGGKAKVKDCRDQNDDLAVQLQDSASFTLRKDHSGALGSLKIFAFNDSCYMGGRAHEIAIVADGSAVIGDIRAHEKFSADVRDSASVLAKVSKSVTCNNREHGKGRIFVTRM